MSDGKQQDTGKATRRDFIKRCGVSAALITGGYEILSVFFKSGAEAQSWDSPCKSATCALCGGSCQTCTGCTKSCTSGCTSCTGCTTSCTSGCTSGCTSSCTSGCTSSCVSCTQVTSR